MAKVLWNRSTFLIESAELAWLRSLDRRKSLPIWPSESVTPNVRCIEDCAGCIRGSVPAAGWGLSCAWRAEVCWTDRRLPYGWTQYAFEHQPAQEYPHRYLPGILASRALGVRRRHGEANPDALAEIEALPRTVVGADGSTVREESAGSPRKGAN